MTCRVWLAELSQELFARRDRARLCTEIAATRRAPAAREEQAEGASQGRTAVEDLAQSRHRPRSGSTPKQVEERHGRRT